MIVVASIFSASAFSSSGEITRSSLATTNQVGFAFQAATVTFVLKHATLTGPCVAVKMVFSKSERSGAKSSHIPVGVSQKNPFGSGLISAPTGAGGYGSLMPKTDSPASGANPAT